MNKLVKGTVIALLTLGCSVGNGILQENNTVYTELVTPEPNTSPEQYYTPEEIADAVLAGTTVILVIDCTTGNTLKINNISGILQMNGMGFANCGELQNSGVQTMIIAHPASEQIDGGIRKDYYSYEKFVYPPEFSLTNIKDNQLFNTDLSRYLGFYIPYGY